jgi:hypothetical protein
VLPGRVIQPDHTRGLTSLSTNIKTLTAKMALLKSDLQSSLPTTPTDSRPQIFETYDSIGQDLHALLADWQSGRADLLRLFEDEDDGSVADSGMGTSIADYDPLNKRVSCGDWGIHVPRTQSPVPLLSPQSPDLPEIEEEGVFEGVARGRVQSGVLSRAERIERARREREAEGERKRVVSERGRWVGELKDVLVRRNR